jgi:plastocyanin
MGILREKTMKARNGMLFLGMTVVLTIGFLLTTGIQKSRAAGTEDKSPKALEIKIDNFSFGPMTVTVAAGTTITWTNDDDVPHTVVSEDHTTFKSRALDTGEKFSYTFTKPGEYPYFCSVHPKMTAKIVVR